MTDRDAVTGWVDRYVSAWDSNDPAAVRALFTAEAQYRFTPSAAPVTGHDAITAAWLDDRDEVGDHAFSWETVAIESDVAVVQGRTEYLAGEAAGRVYDNLWVVRLVADGRAESFTEWWMQRPGDSGE